MGHPKIYSAKAIDDHTLEIEFDNHQKRIYDASHLFDNELFAPLRSPALFKSVKVEQGGYAVSWSDSLDISEFELWSHGSKSIPQGIL